MRMKLDDFLLGLKRSDRWLCSQAWRRAGLLNPVPDSCYLVPCPLAVLSSGNISQHHHLLMARYEELFSNLTGYLRCFNICIGLLYFFLKCKHIYHQSSNMSQMLCFQALVVFLLFFRPLLTLPLKFDQFRTHRLWSGKSSTEHLSLSVFFVLLLRKPKNRNSNLGWQAAVQLRAPSLTMDGRLKLCTHTMFAWSFASNWD